MWTPTARVMKSAPLKKRTLLLLRCQPAIPIGTKSITHAANKPNCTAPNIAPSSSSSSLDHSENSHLSMVSLHQKNHWLQKRLVFWLLREKGLDGFAIFFFSLVMQLMIENEVENPRYEEEMKLFYTHTQFDLAWIEFNFSGQMDSIQVKSNLLPFI